jgi:cyclomaltodextrinase
MPIIPPPSWVTGRVWYHVHALGALGSPSTNDQPFAEEPQAHRLRRLVDWVDHIASLGARGLLLTPVFASLTHGYDTVDPHRIDQRLGDADDLADLIDACHARDVRVLLDGVFNHVSRRFPAFEELQAHGREAATAEWFRVDFNGSGPDGFSYDDFEGHGGLVALNHDADVVLDWAVDVACHWLDVGADGWRLDAAYAVPTAFWKRFSQRVLDRFPEAYLVGEVIHGDYPAFVEASGLHSATQYELHKATWSALNDRNFFELSAAFERHDRFSRRFVPFTFVGNHDVTRLLSRLDEPSHLGHALAVLCTVPGTPSIYYGDEFGFRGVKEEREGGDDAIRPPLPPSPEPADDQQAGVLRVHRQLLGLRAARPWLDTAEVEVIDLANEQLTYRVRGDGAPLRVVLNVGSDTIDVSDAGHAIAGEGAATRATAVSPHSWAVFEET